MGFPQGSSGFTCPLDKTLYRLSTNSTPRSRERFMWNCPLLLGVQEPISQTILDAKLDCLSCFFESRQDLHIRWAELVLVDLIYCNPPDVVVLQLLGLSFLDGGME